MNKIINNFRKSEILYEGEYKENKKVGFWDISWRWE